MVTANKPHTLLKDAVCECGATGLIIKTGQTIEEESNEWVKY